jgi:polyphenol oxidase
MDIFPLPHDTSPLLSDVAHAFFTRQGGVSEGMYASLNAGVGSDDNPKHVEQNRRRLAGFFGKDVSCLASLRQVHSAVCVTVDASYDTASRPEADALVTREKGVILGILTADCVPVLFYDSHATVIGAAHAGWKGARLGVLQATVAAMVALGSDAVNIHASIGASIAQVSYEVESSFRAEFLAQNPAWEQFFIPSPMRPATHYMFDNKAHAKAILLSCGLTQIDVLERDTYTDEERYYSFRRATHRGEADYGRQLSAIML